jgi:murein DD-endopeptidase MepM/ murein hydrolase activator NlpD
MTGNLGTEKLVFYKKGQSEWISFLGIDADQKPGDYKIFVDTSKAEHLTKDIKVNPAGFSSAPTIAVPDIKKDGYTADKAINNITKKDNPALKKVISNITAKPYFDSPFSFPLSKIEKKGLTFGEFVGLAKYKIQHLGVDLKAPNQTKIFAVNNGKVVFTANLSNYGNTIVIDHGLDIFSMYLHLEDFKVNEGDIVKRGQIIGLSGETGYTTAPHLHFSMRVDGSRVDPLTFIETTKKMDDNNLLANISAAILGLFK